jgi:peptide/nickel transport system substrate-binding protein
MSRRKKHARRSHICLAVVVLALVFVCASSPAYGISASPAASRAAGGGVVLKLGWTEEPDNLNVFIGYQSSDYEIWALNYSYLFGCGEDNQPILDLATQFPTKQNGGISADGKVWTIRIRSGVKFQDGTPLSASDVAFTYNYIIKNKMANYLNYVLGIEKATAVNATTVRFTCAHPMALLYMETESVPILPAHIWQHVSASAAASTFGDNPPIIGSGPFETVAFVKGSYVEMVRNPYYYGKRPTVDTIYFEAYQNSNTMVSDLTKGRIDGAWDIPVASFKQIGTSSGVETIAYPYTNWDYLEFNCYTGRGSQGNPVLRDPKFRQALNYAIDKQRLCQLAYEGLAHPATTPISPYMWTNPDYHWQPPASEAYTFDLAKAGQLLTAAGYPLKNGVRLNKQGKPIVLRLEATSDQLGCQTEARLIAGWLQQLGLTIKLSVIDSGTLSADIFNSTGKLLTPNFDMVVWNWTGYFDPGETLDNFTTSQLGIENEPYWSNAEFDRLAVQQSATTDPQQRKDVLWQMQQIFYEQSPWIVLTYPENLEAVNTTRWTGWTREFDGTGGAWGLEGNIASYLNLRPITAAATSSSGSSATLVVVVVIVIIAAGAAFVVLRRRRARRIENEA